MHRRGFKLVGLLLIIVFSLTVLCSCNGGNKGNEKKEITAIPATNVVYNEAGEYTSKLSGIKGVTKDDIKVQYAFFDKDKYDKAVKENTDQSAEIDYSTYYEYKFATLKDVVPGDNDSLTISFSDSDAKVNKTDAYFVIIESKNIGSGIEVQFNKQNIVPNVKSVASNAKSINITLENKNKNYKQNIAKEDIVLGGSFKDMTVASVSNSDENLTMQLTGDIFYDKDAHIYFDGRIIIDSSALKDAGESVNIAVPVTFDNVSFDASSLTIDNAGNVKVAIYCDNVADTKTLTKDKIVFEKGVSVVGVENGDDKAILSLKVDGATDKNSAATLLDGQKVTIGEKKFVAEFASASFYPVFDFVKKEADKFVMTIILYANAGTFAENITKDNVTLGGGFAGAEVISLDRDSDTVANLVIKVNAGDQSVENVDIDGDITLANGVLVNAWGDNADESSYSRTYSKTSLGKDLTGDDIARIKKIVGGFGNTTFGTICALASGAGTAVSVLQTALELTGIVESDAQQIKNLITKMNDQLSSSMNFQTKILKDLHKDVSEMSVNGFVSKVNNLAQYNKYISQYIRYAREDLANQNPKVVAPPKDAPVEDWDAYNDKLIPYLKAQIKAGNDKYKSFDVRYEKMLELYTDVVTNLQVGVDKFDKLCSLVYNTNTIANDSRVLFLSNINRALTDAITNIWLYNGYLRAWGVDPAEETRMYDDASRYILTKESENVDPKTINDTTLGTKNIPVFYLFGNSNTNSIGWSKHDNMDSVVSMSDDAINEFVIRMNGRTLEQELTLAGFDVASLKTKKMPTSGKHNVITHGCDSTVKGIVFRYAERDRGDFCMNFHYNYNYYYHVMNWSDTTASKRVLCWQRLTGWSAYTYTYDNTYYAILK